MIRFTNKITIDRPAKEVFEFLSDFENIPKWNYYVLSVEKVSEGPRGKSTIYHQARREDSQSFEIVEYRPHSTLAVKTRPGSSPGFERSFSLHAVDGRTEIVDDWTLDLGKGGIVERLATPAVKKGVMANMTKLKELLENGRTTLQDGRTVELSV